MQSLIELQNITKDYGSFRALDDVSLTIGPGVTGLLGPNGAGKSTLIKVLLGLVRLTSGTGSVLGYEVGRQAREIRASVGFMPEDDCYLHGLTGVESVQLAARLSRMEPIEGLRRAHEILDFCGAGQERYRTVQTYSTGMRQKLRFAQSIVHDPPLLILDEPTSGLDPEEREAMLSRIEILATRYEKAIILCTHILPDVQAVSDHVVILANGRVTTSESLAALNRPSEPAHEIRYMGDGDKLRSRLSAAGITTVSIETPSAFSVPGGDEKTLQQVWALAGEEGVGIRAVIPARNSLEEIFLEAVGEVQNADS